MRYGLVVGQQIQGWVWSDPSTPYPGEHLVTVGDRLIDLSSLPQHEAEQVIRQVFSATGAARELLLRDYPSTMIPALPTPRLSWEIHAQPGYRRIVQRPSEAWHTQEMGARLRANARLRQGHTQGQVMSEFTHLDQTARQQRAGEPLLDGKFPLTPMVRLTHTGREFPWHETILEF